MIRKILCLCLLFQFLILSVSFAKEATDTHDALMSAQEFDSTEKINKVRLSWEISPRAVFYKVVVLKSAKDTPDNVLLVFDKIFSNGIEIDLSGANDAKNFYYKVCPLNYTGEPVEKFSTPRSILEGEINTTSPKPTALPEEDEDALLYPVYSWIPMYGEKNYEVEVYRRDEENQFLHLLRTNSNSIYEKTGFTKPGVYFWRVRAVDTQGKPTSDWSEEINFTVKGEVKIAALGDSVTHGGGAISVPPSSPVYRYEAYAGFEIKNLGKSGDKTSDMLNRFDKDVLPFNPQILIIMGGVNDIRARVDTDVTIENFMAIKDKCETHNIIPVFVTTTPVNPDLTWRTMTKTTLPWNYKKMIKNINDWIMSQPYAINVTNSLCGGDLYLYPGMTTDGIHPDHVAKEYIGKIITEYIMDNFPDI